MVTIQLFDVIMLDVIMLLYLDRSAYVISYCMCRACGWTDRPLAAHNMV